MLLVGERGTSELGTSGKVGHTPEELHAWAAELHERFGGRPVAIAIEQSRGAVIAALTEHEHLVIYPINPKQAARYREALSVCAKKDDPFDARLLAIFLREHLALLRPLTLDDPLTRELGGTCQFRRKLVDDRTRLKQAAIAELKQFFPQGYRLVRRSAKRDGSGCAKALAHAPRSAAGQSGHAPQVLSPFAAAVTKTPSTS